MLQQAYALVLGTAFRGKFFQGDITVADIESVIRQDKKMYLVVFLASNHKGFVYFNSHGTY